MELRALILDDERRGRELLQQLLTIHCPEVTTILTASSLDEAIAILNTFTPDLLFLDIRLGNGFGLDIIPFLPQPAPYIIVTTAHQEFAIKAIRAKVLDYLLKPIIADELVAAVKKVIEAYSRRGIGDTPTPPSGKFPDADKKITVPTAEGLSFIKLKDIIHCKAEGAYTHIHIQENKSIMVSINLGEMEKLLPENLGFFRVHHAFLINVHEMARYVKNDGGYVVMSDGTQVAVSQRKKSQFLHFIKSLS